LKGLDLKVLREKSNLTQEELGKRLGKSKRTVITWEKSEELSQSQVNQVNSIFLESEEISQYKINSNDLIVNESSEIFKTKAGSVYTENADGSYTITVPLVPFDAYASYVNTYNDEVVLLKDWEKVSFNVDKIGLGKYLGFKTKGDSMNGGSLYDTPDKTLLLAREIGRQHWVDGFRYSDYGFILITKNNMMHKDIIGMDKEKGTVICHSRNKSPEYSDFDLNLNDVYQIFRVIKRTF
jgi:DNA-binding XRE family transcriptional regulator